MTPSLLTRLINETPVVVTGCGVATAAGHSVAALWQTALSGPAPVVRREFDIGGQSRAFAVCAAPETCVGQPRLRRFGRLDRSVQLAWVAATQACAAAGLEPATDPARIGLFLGSSRGPIGKVQEGFVRAAHRRYPPTLSADCTMASLSGALAQALEIHGPCCTLSATCASAAFAIGLAAEQILLGKANTMLAGGTEAPLVPMLLAQLEAAGVVGSHPDPARSCRPFDATRNGFCLGEGSAFLVLESAAVAARRGAVPLARLSGWGTWLDNSGRAGVGIAGTGLVAAANQALELAGLTPDAIDYINAHGTGTRLNDAAEARGVGALFGRRAALVPCTSTKPVTGHCLGATPAMEAVICLEAIRHQTIPPTLNCAQPDPDCAINAQPSAARRTPLRHVLSNSLGFWGNHAALIFSRL
jgi:3-oxoacyl-[acyl-carrier-protein] synthase II